MTSLTTRIEPLGKENFDTWKLQAEALLIKSETWCYVNGSKKKPVLKAGDETSIAEVRKWEEADQKAKSDLILSISPSELKQIKNCGTSNEVWRKLHEIYQSKGPARKASLLKKLITQKMRDGTDVRTHLSEFFDAVDKLLDMGVNINDELLTIVLLYSLPETFENFRCAIESRDDLPTPEALKIKIIEEYDARQTRNTEKDQNAMFARKTHGHDSYVSKSKPFFKYRCHRCRKVGHKAAECRFKTQQVIKAEKSKICVEAEESEKEEIALLQVDDNARRGSWCLDSGCTSHMTSDADNMCNLKKLNKPLNLANGNTTSICGIGNTKLSVSDGKNVKHIVLNDVMFVPDLRTNLMSVAKITDKGYDVKFNKSTAIVTDKNGNTVAIADRKGDLFYVRDCIDSVYFTTAKKNSLREWHLKLGHVNMNYLIDMINKKKVIGIKVDKNTEKETCEICVKAKHVQSPFPEREGERTTELLEIIHSDICGPMRTNSVGGARYFVTFIDDKSRWCEVYFLKKKNEVLNAFKRFKTFAETQCERKIKFLQSDNGLEYCNKEFDSYLADNGIQRRLTVPYTPEQNGIAERKNRTLLETARSLMLQSNLPQMFWAEAVNTSNYIRNRCPSRSLAGSTPFEIWTGRRPNVSYFQIFGTKAFVLDKDPHKDKFSPRSKECIFLGYSKETKGYRLWSPSEHKVVVSRDVKFTSEFSMNEGFEDCFDYEAIQADKNHECAENTNSEIEVTLYDEGKVNKNACNDINMEWEGEPESAAEQNERKRGKGRPKLLKTGKRGRPKKVYQNKSKIKKRKPKETARSPKETESSTPSDSEYETANYLMEPYHLNLVDVLEGDNAEAWKWAIAQEYVAHVKNNTWDIVDRPLEGNFISSKFVLTTKYDDEGKVEKRKARLVARGFTQRRGIDYDETFAPVIRANSIRLLLAIAAENQWTIHQMDVVTAFLNGELMEKVYMEVPKLFMENMQKISNDRELSEEIKTKASKWLHQIRQDESKSKVCLLEKSLYGLKQAGRRWYEKLDCELKNLGLKRTNSEPCIYTHQNEAEILIIAVYVDDLLLISNTETLITKMKEKLKEKFEMKDLGRIHNCLGIEFRQSEDNKIISMCQRKYAEEILKRFGMSECKPVSTPLDVNSKLTKCEETENLQTVPYQNLIGSLMYLAVSTRPDLAHAVSYLSQFNKCHSELHWKAAKRILRYLKRTVNFGLIYTKCSSELIGYADADWGASLDDRRSYTGYAFKMAGACISWESRKQRTVALSSTEAEYMALSDAAKEALYLQKLSTELGVNVNNILIYNDNQGAQRLVQNPAVHNRTKHIDMRYHFIREIVEKGNVSIKYLSTTIMPADVLTKGLPGPKHNQCRIELGVTEVN